MEVFDKERLPPMDTDPMVIKLKDMLIKMYHDVLTEFEGFKSKYGTRTRPNNSSTQ